MTKVETCFHRLNTPNWPPTGQRQTSDGRAHGVMLPQVQNLPLPLVQAEAESLFPPVPRGPGLGHHGNIIAPSDVCLWGRNGSQPAESGTFSTCFRMLCLSCGIPPEILSSARLDT